MMARYPAPMAGWSQMLPLVVDTVVKALAPAMPDRIPAARIRRSRPQPILTPEERVLLRAEIDRRIRAREAVHEAVLYLPACQVCGVAIEPPKRVFCSRRCSRNYSRNQGEAT